MNRKSRVIGLKQGSIPMIERLLWPTRGTEWENIGYSITLAISFNGVGKQWFVNGDNIWQTYDDNGKIKSVSWYKDEKESKKTQ